MFESAANSALLCTPDTVLDLIRKDASIIRSTVEQLLASSEAIPAGKRFMTDAVGFRDDLQ